MSVSQSNTRQRSSRWRPLLRAALLGLGLALGLAPLSSAQAATDAPLNPSGAPPLLGVVGIGVHDLARSAAFYAGALGYAETRRYELGYLNEIIMALPDGSGPSIVLMNWPGDTDRAYDGRDVKLVFYVDDPAASIDRVRAHGGQVDLEAAPVAVLDGAILAMGRDPDGYVIELIGRERPAPQ